MVRFKSFKSHHIVKQFQIGIDKFSVIVIQESWIV